MIVNLVKVDDGLFFVANPAFAAILAGTEAVAKVRVVPDSAITPLTKRLQPCAVPSISATIRAKTLFESKFDLKNAIIKLPLIIMKKKNYNI